MLVVILGAVLPCSWPGRSEFSSGGNADGSALARTRIGLRWPLPGASVTRGAALEPSTISAGRRGSAASTTET
jgi:hypothetical protein